MGVTVSDYNALKLMTIHNNGTDDVCYAYSPIDPSDTIGTGPGEFLPADLVPHQFRIPPGSAPRQSTEHWTSLWATYTCFCGHLLLFVGRLYSSN